MRQPFAAAVLAAGLLAAGCSHVNPYYDPAKRHHTPQGFVNQYPDNPAYRRPEIGFFEGWARRLRNWTATEDGRAPLAPILAVKPDLDFIHRNTS